MKLLVPNRLCAVPALVCAAVLFLGDIACSSSEEPVNAGTGGASAGGGSAGAGTGGTAAGSLGGSGGSGGGACVAPNQQTSCTTTVSETLAPSINCTPKKAGTGEYDGCTPNTPCGAVTGCPLEICDPVDATITTTYTAGNSGYTPPSTLLPPMGTELTGRATGWFARGDGTLDQGSCAYPPVRNLTGVALATVNFGNADWCGACAEVVGISGKRVRVQIVDQCAGCHNYSLDIPGGPDTPLSLLDDDQFTTAYKCAGYDGSLPITWKIVPCETVGGVRVSYLEGYNKWTPAIRLLNHRLPIAMLEEQFGGNWTTLARTTDNKYVLNTRSNDTTIPVVLRLTAVDGATITGTFPTFEPNKLYEASSQF